LQRYRCDDLLSASWATSRIAIPTKAGVATFLET